MSQARLILFLFIAFMSASCKQDFAIDYASDNIPTATLSLGSTPSFVATRTITLATSSNGTEMAFFIDGTCDYYAGQWEPFATSKTLTLPDLDGTHTVSVMYRTGDHFKSSCQSVGLTLDRVAPSAPPTVTAAAKASLLTQSPSFTYTAATDLVSGIAKYQARIVNTGTSAPVNSWVDLASMSPAPMTLSLVEGQSYAFEVRAVDRAGNIGAATRSSVFTGGPLTDIDVSAAIGGPEFDSSGVYKLTFSISSTIASPTVITYNTQDITSIAGLDYDSLNGTVTIPAGQTTASIFVNILEHDEYTTQRSFKLNFSADNAASTYTSQTYLLPKEAITTHGQPSTAVKQISAGYESACALLNNNDIRCWGRADILGTPTYVQRSMGVATAVKVTGLTGTPSRVIAGTESCAIMSDQTLQCWGQNGVDFGMGTADTSVHSSAVAMPFAGVVDYAILESEACVVLSTGDVRCWGYQPNGEFGVGSTSNVTSPTAPTGFSAPTTSDFKAVKVVIAADHACLLLLDHSVKCAGKNDLNQLGNSGAGTSSTSFVVVTGLSDAVDISSIGSTTCVITQTAAVKCWGSNASGQLMTALTTASSATPVTIPFIQATKISVGFDHVCAILTNGNISCWGGNTAGQLGSNLYGSENVSPVQPTNLTAPISDLSAGGRYNCIIDATTSVKCWGSEPVFDFNHVYPVTGRATRYFYSLHDPEDLGNNIVDIRGKGSQMCAIDSNSLFYCWGAPPFAIAEAQTNNTYINDFFTFRPSLAYPTALYDYASGLSHACVITKPARRVFCRGRGTSGQIGNGASLTVSAWTEVTAIPAGDAKQIVAGYYNTCLLGLSGQVRCWGDNSNYQLGVSSGSSSNLPVALAGSASSFTQLEAGATTMCGITTGSVVECWGSNQLGSRGNGTTAGASYSSNVIAGLGSVTQLSTDFEFSTCALNSIGGASCWGFNLFGGFANGTASSTSTPVAAILPTPVVSISNSFVHSYYIAADGSVMGAGLDYDNGLNSGATASRTSVIPVPGLEGAVTKIAQVQHISPVNYNTFMFMCALINIPNSSHRVKCWGGGGVNLDAKGQPDPVPRVVDFDQ